MRNFLSVIVSFIILFSFTACEYELSGEYYHDISQPADYHEGQITLSKDMDSIVIYEPTSIHYAVNTFGLKCNGIQFQYLDKEIINSYSSDGTFNITPDYSIKGWFDLKADFYLGTGTGSIADKFKLENYIGTKTWKVCFLELSKYDFKFQHHINSDGFLELFWIKPSFLPEIRSAVNETYTNHPEISKIVGDTTFFVDSTYFGGNSNYYTLSLSLNDRSISRTTIQPDYSLPEFYFERLGLDSVIVSWTKSPLNVNYKAYNGNAYQRYIYIGVGNSFKTKCLAGIEMTYYLEVYPFKYTPYSFNRATINAKYRNGDSANYKFTYSYVKDQFYIPGTSNSSILEKVDLTSSEGNSYAINGVNKFELWGNHLGTRFVGLYSGDIHIFDENLNEVRKLNVWGPYDNYGGQITVNNCFAFYSYSDSLCHVINVGDNTNWQQFTFKPATSTETINGSIRLSLDGKYAFWRGSQYFIIYDISNYQNASIVYQCPSSEIISSMGNPLNFSEIIISKQDKIEVRSLPNFQLLRQIDLEGKGNSILLTVDTYSNTFLALSKNYFHVISIESMKEKLKFSGDINNYALYGARLHRNIFFLNGIKIDLTPYMNKQ